MSNEIRLPAMLDTARAQALAATLGLEIGLSDGDALPPFFHQIYFWEAVPPDRLGRDGHPKQGLGLVPDLGLRRRMWAGGRLDFHHPLHLGRVAERRSHLSRIDRKTGRSGALAFVTLTHGIWQDDRLCVTEDQTLVYREDGLEGHQGDPEGAPPAPQAPIESDGAGAAANKDGAVAVVESDAAAGLAPGEEERPDRPDRPIATRSERSAPDPMTPSSRGDAAVGRALAEADLRDGPDHSPASDPSATRSEPPAAERSERPDPDVREPRQYSSTTLFRYSALTFNGHRIHYDLSYATGVEGYGGLVVHGPLLAQELMLIAARDAPIAAFSFRATRPLLAGARVVYCRSGDTLWAEDAEGRLLMEATARLTR